jgi:hypothetical protein
MKVKTNRSIVAGLIAICVAMNAGGATSKSKKGAGASSPKTSSTTASSQVPARVQPKLVAINVDKCFGCQSRLRKRVALMPIKIGSLASELDMSPEGVASIVRDRLEAELAKQEGLIVLSRSELGDVVAEQKISDSAATNQELAPAKGRIIPAQLLIAATVDRVDVQESSHKDSNSSAETYERQALAKEREADSLERDAADTENERVSSNAAAYMGVVCATAPLYCSGQKGQAYLDCYQRAQQKQLECNEKARDEQERDLQRKRDENGRMAADKRSAAASVRREAQRLRQQAAIEAQQNVTVTQTKTVMASIAWRAIDTSTAAVAGSGAVSGIGNDTQRGVSQTSAYRSSSSTDSSRYQVVVNRAVENVVTNLARAINEKVGNEPFRAKIVRVSGDGIIINAGSNVGMAVGDAFGVRKKHDILTDPDTGAPLETPGPPIGVIRVSEVNEKTSFAQMIAAGGALDRGDELEWIGMYEIRSPVTPATSPQR